MAWTEFDVYGSSDPAHKSRIRFSFSEDNSDTWQDPIIICDSEGDCVDGDNTMEGAVPSIGNNGEIFIAWSGPDGIYFDKSTDGGLTFGQDIIISDMPGGWAFDVPSIYRCNGMPFTAYDNSDSTYGGNLYVMWSDQRNGPNDTDIFLMKSSDGGTNWSNRIMVNNDNTGTHQFFPNITVDPVTGIIYIIYYDRSQTSGVETEVWLARSTDGGDTFDNYKVSTKSFVPTGDIFFGDYIDITAYNGVIYPAWMELHNGSMSIWTSKIEEKDFQ